eukprot:TRINITY_DN6924_c0_g1_i1.p1 TRINITY_DN6924_c0_g1~~TRINITY_DN6924_c0_g1_i1.p1  ORF type:complete len:122 (-),score=5.28 TRINITY_DN6924_c0_g1_i1:59-424(-)
MVVVTENSNNFETLRDCQIRCDPPKPVCDPVPGRWKDPNQTALVISDKVSLDTCCRECHTESCVHWSHHSNARKCELYLLLTSSLFAVQSDKLNTYHHHVRALWNLENVGSLTSATILRNS